MTTIPSRLARVSQSSGSLLDARRRVIQLYRDWYRTRNRVNLRSERSSFPPSSPCSGEIRADTICNRLGSARCLDSQGSFRISGETMNCWKQEPHIMGILLRDLHEGSAVGQTFLQKFYAGRDEESVRIASPQQ
ncbi:hypothetical protein AG1IA_01668 [Rhizoctonia solani AG-1 IA]|uniref:Uncharacterized protein n=1 Tax=Thanatephorus cucumeris (strain AG1-IA) TaxID=983506 RepID=L8X5D2_THACA|nr:hypothetical protein AG1IA_01668 [Rhizoctonia solani AG-1 IA]